MSNKIWDRVWDRLADRLWGRDRAWDRLKNRLYYPLKERVRLRKEEVMHYVE